MSRSDLIPQGLKLLFSIACAVIIIAGLKVAAEVLIPVVVAFFIAALVQPITQWLERRRLPHFLTVTLTVSILIGFLALIGLIATNVLAQFQSAAPRYAEELKIATVQWADKADALRLKWAGNPNAEQTHLARVTTRQAVMGILDFEALVRFIKSADIVGKLTSLFKTTFFIMILVVFLLAEAPALRARLKLIREADGPDFFTMGRASEDIQRYLSVKTLISAATGILAGLSCHLFGLEFALLWGIVAYLLNYIPAIGSVVAAIPPIILALLQFGTWSAVGVGVAYLTINMILGNFLDPLLLGKRFGISTLVVLLSVLFWGYVWGVVGMFLAVPLTMLVKVLFDNTKDFRWLSKAMGKGSEDPEAEAQTP